MSTRPLILFTNDDGIDSPGLWAVVMAFTDLGEVLVCAPREQQSGTGRSLPVTSKGSIHVQQMTINGDEYTVYAVDGTPAQAVQHAVLELAQRPPSLLVSGINYGDNTGNGVTISGASVCQSRTSAPAKPLAPAKRCDSDDAISGRRA